ncbi:ATP-binding protein [Bdellovibrio sp. SKB1291214]|uniref:ATP-binding protein n=1 Tax=Bdellovibrio sp. SKB1291214 TaxID=1732569 RepID=UPI000B51E5CD|nr:ATP-binding protein [Bdellovibrio sp. SKB1291214]UYL07494.1 ATP-binding protein [Bdellovibrio sp. SKB1291214]
MKGMEKKTYRKISEKITLTLAVWLFIITALATFFSYLHITSIVTSLVMENLDKYIEVRSDRESQVFRLATKNQQILAHRLEWHLKNGLDRVDERFNKIFRKYPDGATREKDEIDNKLHPSYFLPNFQKIDKATKERSIIMYDFLDRECFLSTATFSDCWVADAWGSLGTLLEEEVGYSAKIPGDFKNMDQIWMQNIIPENNPNLEQKWTKTYYDPAWQVWMITLATPIVVDGKFTGAIGNDIFVGQMLDRIMKFKLSGTKNLVINSEGYMVAHPKLQDQIKQSDALLKVSDLKDKDPLMEKIFLTAKKELPFEKDDHDGHVFDLGSKDLIAIGKVKGPNWYLVTLYPKSLIQTAAFNSSRYILFFGCISLILELFLMMRLLKEKLARPLKSLVTTVQQVSAGDLGAKVTMRTRDEFEILGDAFNEMTYNLGISRAESHDAMNKAIEAARVKSDFVANISHEMKTPLNGILGMTHFLNDTNLTDEQRKYANLITESGNSLLAIVNQVLDVSKIDAKKMELAEVEFSLNKLLEDVYTLNHFVAKQKGIPIDMESSVTEEERPFVGDPDRLKQILNNLISNALKFSDMGSVLITVNEVGRSENTRRIRFVVKDQGIGISEEAQSRLFQPFTQADMSMSRQYGGAGLGLYIVKSFVTLMNGTVGVKSIPGEGSEFWFEINLGFGAAPQSIAPPVVIPTTPKVTLPILVVEDNFVNQVLTEALLKKLEYTSKVVNDGQEAVNIFEEGKFCLILMDCQMPIMDGFEATRQIRKKESQDFRIPIIALTANTENDNRQVCLDAGMDDMLSKLVKVAIFKEKLEYWLTQSQKKL